MTCVLSSETTHCCDGWRLSGKGEVIQVEFESKTLNLKAVHTLIVLIAESRRF